MAFQNTNNDNAVQTRSTSSTSDANAQTPILLMTAFQNDMLKLTFCNELPASQQTETMRFDRKNPIVTCIVRDKCNVLYEAYEKELKPMLEGETPMEPHSVSITVANVNQIALATAPDGNGGWQTELRLIKGIDPQTLTSTNVTTFVFPKGEYITDYNPNDGSFKDRKITHNGIDVFASDLNTFKIASSKAYVHAARCVDKSYKDMMYDAIVQIGNKVGAEIQQRGQGTGARYGSGSASLFDKSSNSSTINSMPSMSLDDLEKQLQGDGGFMNPPESPDDELPFQ